MATSTAAMVIARPVTSMPFCQPTAMRRSRMTGSVENHDLEPLTLRSSSRRSPGTVILFALSSCMAQYLTLGSSRALTTSTTKLTTETMIAMRMTMPWTATKSRFLR